MFGALLDPKFLSLCIIKTCFVNSLLFAGSRFSTTGQKAIKGAKCFRTDFLLLYLQRILSGTWSACVTIVVVRSCCEYYV